MLDINLRVLTQNGKAVIGCDEPLPQEIATILKKTADTYLRHKATEETLDTIKASLNSVITNLALSGALYRSYDGRLICNERNLERYFSICYQY
jgi:hypothetical protein